MNNRYRAVVEFDSDATLPRSEFQAFLFRQDMDDSKKYNISNANTVEFEKVAPPFPTAAGSVIIDNGSHEFFMLSSEGYWVNEEGFQFDSSEIISGDLAVKFDAGA